MSIIKLYVLTDIANAIEDAERYRSKFKYRIGTVILHEKENGKVASLYRKETAYKKHEEEMLQYLLDVCME